MDECLISPFIIKSLSYESITVLERQHGVDLLLSNTGCFVIVP